MPLEDKTTRYALIVIVVMATIIGIMLWLAGRAKATAAKGICAEGSTLILDPQSGNYWCLDAEGNMSAPECTIGMAWAPSLGKCVDECPTGWRKDETGTLCVRIPFDPTTITVRGRVIGKRYGTPVQGASVAIEYLYQGTVRFDNTSTDGDGRFIFEVTLEPVTGQGGPIWLKVYISHPDFEPHALSRQGVVDDVNFGDITLLDIDPGPSPEGPKIFQCREYLGGLPFDGAFPIGTFTRHVCDPIDLTGVSGEWKGNVFYYPYELDGCPGGVPDSDSYFFFKDSQGNYYVAKIITEGYRFVGYF